MTSSAFVVLACFSVAMCAASWSYPVGKGAVVEVVVDDRHVYAPLETYLSRAGVLYALNRSTGALLWQVVPGDYLWAILSRNDGVIFLGYGNQGLQCLDAATGKVLWDVPSLTLPGEAVSMIMHRGVLVVAVGFAGVVGLDPGSGQALWGTPLALREGFSGDSQGHLYVGLQHGVAALDVSNGAVVWTYTNPGGSNDYTSTNPQFSKQYVMASNNEGFFALNASTGAQLWSGAPNASFAFFFSAVHNDVLLACGNGGLFGLSIYTGAILWTQPDFNFFTTTVDRGVVYAPFGSQLVGLDANSGVTVFKQAMSWPLCSDCIWGLQVMNATAYYSQTFNPSSFSYSINAVSLQGFKK